MRGMIGIVHSATEAALTRLDAGELDPLGPFFGLSAISFPNSVAQNRSRSRPALPGADAARSVRAGRGRQRRALAVSELKVHECDSLDRRARNDPAAKAAIH
jgi:hypothetical protein